MNTLNINKPTDQKLYNKIKERVYKEMPKHSAYRSMRVVKEYKEAGGKYSNDKKPKMNIDKWLGQKWSSVNDYYHDNKVVACGSTDTMKKYGEYPLCRPLAIIKKLSKNQMQDMIKEKNKLKEGHLDTSDVLGSKKYDIKSTKSGL